MIGRRGKTQGHSEQEGEVMIMMMTPTKAVDLPVKSGRNLCVTYRGIAEWWKPHLGWIWA